MEKLIELLNDYEVYKGYNSGGWEMTSMGLVYAKNIRDKGAIITLKSKEYGFIERLVKNDKIDYSAVDSQNWRNLQEELDCRLSDKLLMILSIQDNPIEYLCSILR